jgi:hypothetical protein
MLIVAQHNVINGTKMCAQGEPCAAHHNWLSAWLLRKSQVVVIECCGREWLRQVLDVRNGACKCALDYSCVEVCAEAVHRD